MFTYSISLIFLLMSFNLNAAVDKNLSQYNKPIISILEKPLKLRKQFVLSNHKNYKKLAKVVKQSQYHLSYRWKALSTLASLRNKKSLKLLVKTTKAKEWFLRDISLKALLRYYPSKAAKFSRSLLTDPSLIVRTTAVRNIKALSDIKSESLLWRQLYSRQNFRKKQSLWVRKHIVSALAGMVKKSSISKRELNRRFIKLLSDKDKSLYKPAIRAISRINGLTINPKLSTKKYRKKYLGLWKNNKLSATF